YSMNGVVAYFVNEKGVNHTLFLLLILIVKSYYGVNIAESLLNVLKEYQIETWIGYFIVDNAPNNNTAL
ncbi:hypothetical protein K469DRAFT_527490, partial [Zopfia rhizophila CBS 207.26]